MHDIPAPSPLAPSSLDKSSLDKSSLDGRRRRLLFRANHRGTRENDILVGGFVSARLADFSEQEIAVLEAIMELPDPLLAEWLTGRAPVPAEHDGAMLRAMVEARGR